MFGLSLSHLILFGIIVLIFVGPEQLPEVARTIARLINELRRATSDIQSHFTNQVDLHKILDPQPPPPASATPVEPTPEASVDPEKKS